MPMIIMETGCGGLYAISLLFGRDSVAANVLAYFYNITGAYISFGNLLSRCIVIFLIILMLCIGKGMESKVVRYYLGEEIKIVNPAYETAMDLKKLLYEKEMANDGTDAQHSVYSFYVSDAAEKFRRFANTVMPFDVPTTNVVNIEEY